MISKQLLLVSVIFFSSGIVLASDAPNKLSIAIQQEDPVSRELKSEQMGPLDNMLALFPITIVRMKCAEQQARAVKNKTLELSAAMLQRSVNQQDQKIIQDQIKAVIEPVRQFFDLIKNYKDIAQPLVQESLDGQPYRNGKAPNQSLLYQFFDKQISFDTLALQDIKTVEDLTLLCNDIIALCGSVIKSSSPRSKAAFEKIMSQMNSKKKPQSIGA